MVSTGNASEAHGDCCAARCLRSGNDPKDAHVSALVETFFAPVGHRSVPTQKGGRFRFAAPHGSFITEEILESGRLKEPNLRGKEERGPPPEQLRSDDGANRNNMLVCGDGIVQHRGYKLCECVLYGCSNAHGGPEQMFEMEETTLDM